MVGRQARDKPGSLRLGRGYLEEVLAREFECCFDGLGAYV
jgi:hypothetical protein